MEKYYYFYDLNEVLIDRYPAKIASEILSVNSKSKFMFIFSEQYNNTEPINTPDGSKFIFSGSLSIKELNKIVSQYPPISLTTIAQRIPDMWMLSYFNQLGLPTFVVQHGLWSDRLERISLISLISRKFSKFINYLKHVSSICRMNKIPLIPTLIEFYKFLLKENINIPNSKYLRINVLRAKNAFIFDETWDKYYTNKYGYPKKSLNYIGNPDFMLIKDKKLSEKENACCYLCQSLVEDGRIGLKTFKLFLEILNRVTKASRSKLYIKLHPRSRPEIYNIFLENNNVILTHDLPICKYYIAHYTGLLATVKLITDNILIWNFSNHHVPEYFFKFSLIVTNNENEMLDFLQRKLITKSNSSFTSRNLDMIHNYATPIKIIAENIIKLSR